MYMFALLVVYTLKMGIEEALKAQMPEVHEVVPID